MISVQINTCIVLVTCIALSSTGRLKVDFFTRPLEYTKNLRVVYFFENLLQHKFYTRRVIVPLFPNLRSCICLFFFSFFYNYHIPDIILCLLSIVLTSQFV
jgi:hypothetical protein